MRKCGQLTKYENYYAFAIIAKKMCLYLGRVGIPVILMGETGCGKTRLIEFMSKIMIPTALKEKIQTMIILKVSVSVFLFVFESFLLHSE